MKRLFGCSVSLIYQDEHGEARVSSLVADRAEFWWDERKPDDRSLWDSKIRLGEDLFNEIIQHAVPLDMNTLAALKRSPLGLDLYLWLVYRTFPLRAPLRLSWRALYRQFGADPAKANDKLIVNAFRTDSLRELKKIKIAWPELNYTTAKGVLILSPSKPAIAPTTGPREPSASDGGETTFQWQSRKPTSERTTKNRKVPSGGSGGRCAGSSSRSSNWTTPIRRARNASSSARRPVNASRSDERGELSTSKHLYSASTKHLYFRENLRPNTYTLM